MRPLARATVRQYIKGMETNTKNAMTRLVEAGWTLDYSIPVDMRGLRVYLVAIVEVETGRQERDHHPDSEVALITLALRVGA